VRPIAGRRRQYPDTVVRHHRDLLASLYPGELRSSTTADRPTSPAQSPVEIHAYPDCGVGTDIAEPDHVTLLLPIGTEFAPGIDRLVHLAPALNTLG
jgi:hypothetical protein